MRLKREYPHWGAPKIRERLRRRFPDLLRCPAISTVHAVLDRRGLVERRRRRRYQAHGTPLSRPVQPNELWCADFKGEFKLGNGFQPGAHQLGPRLDGHGRESHNRSSGIFEGSP